MRTAVIFSVLLPCLLAAEDLRQTLGRAQESYRRQDFEEASRLYAEALDRIPHNADLHYNLAACRYRLGDLPAAVLHYEKSLRLRPGRPDAEANLRLVRSRLFDEEAADLLPNPFLAAGARLFGLLDLDAWTVLGVVGFSLASAALVLLLSADLPRFRRFLVGTVVLGLLGTSLAAVRLVVFESDRRAVVISPEAVLTKDSAEETVRLPPGTTVRLLGASGEFRRVRTPAGETGRVKAADLTEI